MEIQSFEIERDKTAILGLFCSESNSKSKEHRNQSKKTIDLSSTSKEMLRYGPLIPSRCLIEELWRIREATEMVFWDTDRFRDGEWSGFLLGFHRERGKMREMRGKPEQREGKVIRLGIFTKCLAEKLILVSRLL